MGKVDGFVLFVPGAAPGDRLEVELVALKKKYGRGRIVKIVKPSRRRVKPPCPVYEACGGCQFQHLDYDSQLTIKTKMVRDAIEHLGSLDGVEIKPCKGMKNPWAYRNKAMMMVAGRPYLQSKTLTALDSGNKIQGGPPAQRLRPYFGFYAQRTHRVVPIDECLIQTSENNHLLQAARNMVEPIRAAAASVCAPGLPPG